MTTGVLRFRSKGRSGLLDHLRTILAGSVQVDRVGWTRVAAVAAAPLLASSLGHALYPLVYLAVGGWVAATATGRYRKLTCTGDAVAAVALVLLYGELANPYLMFILTASVAAGVRAGPVAGVGAGAAISLSQGTLLVLSGDHARLDADVLLPVLALAPLTGLTGALGARVLTSNRSGRSVLTRANRLLVALQGISDEIPGGLDVPTVAQAALSEVRTVCPSSQVLVYVGSGAILEPLGSTPSDTPAPPIHLPALHDMLGARPFRLVSRSTATALLGPARADECAFWSLTPLRQRSATIGLIAVGHPDFGSARGTQGTVADVAVDASIALDNALLFDATRARALDRARRQIAHDLHDSVAQSLAHLRMELELLTLQVADDGSLADETSRLARVAGRALEDVRSTIAGLRSRVCADGLPEALGSHVADLQGLGSPTLTFEVAGEAEVPPLVQEQLLRLAQEAISNAVRHADADEVTVSLELSEDFLELVIEDDGSGIDPTVEIEPGHGVGLRAMRERSLAIGGDLTIRDRVGGGTVVAVVCPLRGGSAALSPVPGRASTGRERR